MLFVTLSPLTSDKVTCFATNGNIKLKWINFQNSFSKSNKSFSKNKKKDFEKINETYVFPTTSMNAVINVSLLPKVFILPTIVNPSMNKATDTNAEDISFKRNSILISYKIRR